MPTTTRTFVAIAIPEPLGSKLTRLQALLSPEVPRCRWIASLPFHATLVFLGDVPDTDLSGLCAAIASSTRTVLPFEVELKSVGAFPGAARPSVIWAGLTGADLAPLLDLQKQIARAVAGFGYQPDARGFHPHVTLGRLKFGRPGTCDLSGLLERYRSWSGGVFRVDEVIAFASTLGKDGPRYDPLARAPLAGTMSIASP
jgi:RNA 2',3'-cyclic 3'-phosphodiesterase